MSNLPTIPAPTAIKALTFLLPVLALVQVGFSALLILGGLMSAATGGGSEGPVVVVFGIALAPCVLVTIIAIFTLRRRSRMMRIAVTVSSLMTIAAVLSVVIRIASHQTAEAEPMMMYVIMQYSIPFLVVFTAPVVVLSLLWGVPAARAFFKAPPTSP